MKRLLIALLFVGGSMQGAAQATEVDSLRENLNAYASQEVLPGFVAAVVNEEGVLFQDAFGYANLQTKQPYTPATVQLIASTTKTTVAFAIMKLVEAGKLQLDTPVSDLLPFPVSNPHTPSIPITLRHLATHTAGILDTENNYELRGRYFVKQTSLDDSPLDQESIEYLNGYAANEKLSLATYCERVFSPTGEWYAATTYSQAYVPGEHYQYSNLSATLAALVVEQVSGQLFHVYVEEQLFQPLELTSSTYDVERIDPERLATAYVDEALLATPVLGENTYPDGGLYSCGRDLSRYLVEMIKGYHGESELLTEASFQTMMNAGLASNISYAEDTGRNFDNIGVFWQRNKIGEIVHNGGNPLGGTVYFAFDPETRLGRLLMTNCDVRASRNMSIAFLSIWRTMGNFSSDL